MKKVIFLIMAVLFVISITACGDSGLSGTFERENETYKFSGKNYTRTYIITEIDEEATEQKQKELEQREEEPIYFTPVYKEVEVVEKGTYSITDDKIEFKTEDGDIVVWSFSRTENTITIDGNQYKRV
jgi:uncharacterized lipoprotein YehR (DUF1307 family)